MAFSFCSWVRSSLFSLSPRTSPRTPGAYSVQEGQAGMGHLHRKPAQGGSLFPLLSGLPPCGGAEPHTREKLVTAGSRDWPLASSSLAQGSQGAEGLWLQVQLPLRCSVLGNQVILLPTAALFRNTPISRVSQARRDSSDNGKSTLWPRAQPTLPCKCGRCRGDGVSSYCSCLPLPGLASSSEPQREGPAL